MSQLLLLFLFLVPISLVQGQAYNSNIRRLESSLLSGSFNGNQPTKTPLQPQNEFLGIPGTTQTKNGFDTALGNDAICWLGFTNSTIVPGAPINQGNSNTSAVDLVKQVFPNPLVEDFVFLETKILTACPPGNTVRVEKPVEAQRGERLRTLRLYNYTVYVEIDLDHLNGESLITDERNDTIALQVVVCRLGKSGFCSPFVHEQGMLKFYFS